MSSWYCLSPFQKLLLKGVHRILIRWISIIRLLEESPTLTSFLISFTRSISHFLLVVLVTDCQFWRLLRVKVLIMVVTKTLASVTTGLLIMLPFRHALLTACGNRHFSNYFEIQLPSLSPRHRLLRLILQSNFLTDIVLRAVKTLVLGKRIKIRPRNLVAASGRSCLTITFNICTITCAVASYVHYMISFDMCRHSCAKFVIWLQMSFIVLESFTLQLSYVALNNLPQFNSFRSYSTRSFSKKRLFISCMTDFWFHCLLGITDRKSSWCRKIVCSHLFTSM